MTTTYTPASAVWSGSSGKGDGLHRMVNLERGFRRLTFAVSVLLASPFLVDGVLSFFETGRVHYVLLVPMAIGFVLPWLVFCVARWVAAGFHKE
jgi:hypothetical protein